MSADNGFVIRKNRDLKFVLQEYSASDSNYPDITKADENNTFDTLEEAISAFNKVDYPVEYGLRVHVDEVYPPEADDERPAVSSSY